jgi:hypothetical protein
MTEIHTGGYKELYLLVYYPENNLYMLTVNLKMEISTESAAQHLSQI